MMDLIRPNITQNVSNLFLNLYVTDTLYNSIGRSLKGRCWGGSCLKRLKLDKIWQLLQSYNTAQFVQYG
jgi:hypothetical protein